MTSDCRVKRVICKTWTGTLTNSANPDQTPQYAASDQGMHCLLNNRKLRVKFPFRKFSQPTLRDNRVSILIFMSVIATVPPCLIVMFPIKKIRLFKYIKHFTSKNWKFSDKKKLWYFSYFCSKHRLRILVRTAPQSMFLSTNKKK